MTDENIDVRTSSQGEVKRWIRKRVREMRRLKIHLTGIPEGEELENEVEAIIRIQ